MKIFLPQKNHNLRYTTYVYAQRKCICMISGLDWFTGFIKYILCILEVSTFVSTRILYSTVMCVLADFYTTISFH